MLPTGPVSPVPLRRLAAPPKEWASKCRECHGGRKATNQKLRTDAGLKPKVQSQVPKVTLGEGPEDTEGGRGTNVFWHNHRDVTSSAFG